MTQSNVLPMWTVYEMPADLPNEFVARKWLAVGGELQATSELVRGDSLDAVRDRLPAGLYRLPRNPEDDPRIVETWL